MKKRYAGAVDIGGTKILVGITDEKGKVVKQNNFATIIGENGAELSTGKILAILKKQCNQANILFEELEGIGIVCAGPVDSKLGTVENPYTLAGWSGFQITKRIHELSGKKACLENDANGFLLGEIFLRGLQKERVLMITFGTGIGVAFYQDEKLYRTGGRFHPEMGHMIVADEGPDCYCGHKGCFESLWSGSAINRRAMELGYKDFDQLHEAWVQGEEKAGYFMDRAKRQFANGIWNLMTLVKPDILILGGGFMCRYFEFAVQIIQQDLEGLSDFLEPHKILKAGEQGASALAGAAGLIFNLKIEQV